MNDIGKFLGGILRPASGKGKSICGAPGDFQISRPAESTHSKKACMFSYYWLDFAGCANGGFLFPVGGMQPVGGRPPFQPARNLPDSRTRVRRPSITAGIGLWATPWIRKIISAASPGE